MLPFRNTQTADQFLLITNIMLTMSMNNNDQHSLYMMPTYYIHWWILSQTIHLMTPTSHPNRYIQTLFQLYNNSGISTDPLYSCIQTLSQISPKNTSTYCSPPHQVLLPSPWHRLFTITNSYSMPLISISIVHSSWTLFLLFFYSCIITTHAHFPLQTLFFSTHINMSCMY